jgi:hypothetical protein
MHFQCISSNMMLWTRHKVAFSAILATKISICVPHMLIFKPHTTFTHTNISFMRQAYSYSSTNVNLYAFLWQTNNFSNFDIEMLIFKSQMHHKCYFAYHTSNFSAVCIINAIFSTTNDTLCITHTNIYITVSNIGVLGVDFCTTPSQFQQREC